MKIIPLSEGSFTIDKTKQFVPFNIENDNLQQRPVGSLLVEIQPFCILTNRDVIVLDTGLGFSDNNGTMQIHQNLLNNGINPMDVTKVLISHLHKDHAGGISKKDKILQQQFFTFPSATYYVNKSEFQFANEGSNKSYITDDFCILKNADNVIFTEGNGTIDEYIKYEVTGAHCPYHQVFFIEEAGQKIFFGADVAPQLNQMKSKFIAKYDYDGKLSMQLRQQWWQRAQTENWTMLFYHDIKTPFIQP